MMMLYWMFALCILPIQGKTKFPINRLIGGSNRGNKNTGFSNERKASIQQTNHDSTALLQIECMVEGTRLEAHIDTGAQVTVMSKSCAQKCGLMSLIDRRFSGDAKGVGSTRITGKIKGIEMWIGTPSDGVKLKCVSVVVLEDLDPDMLLGIDLLRRGDCEIRILDGKLRYYLKDHDQVDYDHQGEYNNHVCQRDERMARKQYFRVANSPTPKVMLSEGPPASRTSHNFHDGRALYDSYLNPVKNKYHSGEEEEPIANIQRIKGYALPTSSSSVEGDKSSSRNRLQQNKKAFIEISFLKESSETFEDKSLLSSLQSDSVVKKIRNEETKNRYKQCRDHGPGSHAKILQLNRPMDGHGYGEHTDDFHRNKAVATLSSNGESGGVSWYHSKSKQNLNVRKDLKVNNRSTAVGIDEGDMSKSIMGDAIGEKRGSSKRTFTLSGM